MRTASFLAGPLLWMILAASSHAGCHIMADQAKLGPQLLERLQENRAEQSELLPVLIGLSDTATPQLLDDLERRGLVVRSVAGDVLTGMVSLEHLEELAAHQSILKIDASGPVFPENDDAEGPPIDID